MRVLYVTGACLLKNTSANMSHNAYVKGLIDNGADLDIIMASDSWGESDSMFQKQSGDSIRTRHQRFAVFINYINHNFKILSDKNTALVGR